MARVIFHEPSFVLPECDELGFSNVARVTRMREPMDADLQGAKTLHGIDLKRAGNELSMHLSADVVLDGVDESLPSDSEAGLVVVELKVFRDQRAKLIELAVVVSGEELGIQTGDCFV